MLRNFYLGHILSLVSFLTLASCEGQKQDKDKSVSSSAPVKSQPQSVPASTSASLTMSSSASASPSQTDKSSTGNTQNSQVVPNDNAGSNTRNNQGNNSTTAGGSNGCLSCYSREVVFPPPLPAPVCSCTSFENTACEAKPGNGCGSNKVNRECASKNACSSGSSYVLNSKAQAGNGCASSSSSCPSTFNGHANNSPQLQVTAAYLHADELSAQKVSKLTADSLNK